MGQFLHTKLIILQNHGFDIFLSIDFGKIGKGYLTKINDSLSNRIYSELKIYQNRL